MKRCLCLSILIIVVVLSFGSWVNPDTLDLWQGNITYVSSSYDVTHLSGTIEFYLDSYDGLCLTDSGYLYNSSNVALNGSALISGTQYDIRLSSLGELQIYQQYTRNGYTYSTWVDYHLHPDDSVIPGAYSLDSMLLIFAVILLSFILILIVVRVFA